MTAPRVVSWSELDTARQCPLKHQLTYVERWTKDPDVLSPLSKGTAWHKVMEAHYREILARQRAGGFSLANERQILAACREQVDRVIEGEIAPLSDELADLADWMYTGYVLLYGIDHGWRILAVEHPAEVALPTPRGGRSQFRLKIKVDLIIADLVSARKHGGQPPVYVVDHKSTKNLPKDREFDLDDQFCLYTWGLHRLGKQVFGQMYNGARTERLVGETTAWRSREYTPGTVQKLDARFLRHRMYRTDDELFAMAVEAYQTMRTRYAEQARATAQGTTSPRNPDPDRCRWRCNFLEPCLMGRKTDPDQMREYLDAKGYLRDRDRH